MTQSDTEINSVPIIHERLIDPIRSALDQLQDSYPGEALSITVARDMVSTPYTICLGTDPGYRVYAFGDTLNEALAKLKADLVGWPERMAKAKADRIMDLKRELAQLEMADPYAGTPMERVSHGSAESE